MAENVIIEVKAGQKCTICGKVAAYDAARDRVASVDIEGYIHGTNIKGTFRVKGLAREDDLKLVKACKSLQKGWFVTVLTTFEKVDPFTRRDGSKDSIMVFIASLFNRPVWGEEAKK